MPVAGEWEPTGGGSTQIVDLVFVIQPATQPRTLVVPRSFGAAVPSNVGERDDCCMYYVS